MTSENDIILSVIVSVYNHERYISEALDSILMQKTNFKMEVLVGDDFSTDNTRDILREYEKNHPGFFTMFYRDHNMFREAVTSSKDLMNRAKGKYVIVLEGDDFWTDENKLQKQVDFLESHPEYIAVAHNCIIVDENSKPTGRKYHECKDTEYTLEHYALDILPGQNATVMRRNLNKNPLIDTSFMDLNIMPGDRRMQQTMSAYRYITSGGSSFSATQKFDYNQKYRWHFEQLKYANKVKNKKAVKCAEMLLLKLVLTGYKKHCISFSQVIKEFFKLSHPFYSVYLLIWRLFKLHLK